MEKLWCTSAELWRQIHQLALHHNTAHLQLMNLALMLSAHFQFKFQYLYLYCMLIFSSFTSNSSILHTHLQSKDAHWLKRHWLKLLIMKINKNWLYLVVIHPVICKHLCAHFHVLPVYVYIYLYTRRTCIYICVYTHIIYTPIYAYLWLCMCTRTYTRQKSFTNMQRYLAIQIKGATH